MEGLADQHLVLIAKLICDVSVLVIPERISVCRVHSRISVDVELSERMSHYKLGIRVGKLVLLDSVVKLHDTVVVVADVGIEVP